MGLAGALVDGVVVEDVAADIIVVIAGEHFNSHSPDLMECYDLSPNSCLKNCIVFDGNRLLHGTLGCEYFLSLKYVTISSSCTRTGKNRRQQIQF